MTTQQGNVTLDDDDGDAGSVGRPPGEKALQGPVTHPDHQESGSLLRRNRDLAVLYAIAGHLNRKVDVHEALQEVLAQVTKLLGLQKACVWLLKEQDNPYLASAPPLPPVLPNH